MFPLIIKVEKVFVDLLEKSFSFWIINSSLFHEDFHFKWTNQSVDKVLASQAQGPVFP